MIPQLFLIASAILDTSVIPVTQIVFGGNPACAGLIRVDISEDFVLESDELFVEQLGCTRKVNGFKIVGEGIPQ